MRSTITSGIRRTTPRRSTTMPTTSSRPSGIVRLSSLERLFPHSSATSSMRCSLRVCLQYASRGRAVSI
jgi:hypothetical protein